MRKHILKLTGLSLAFVLSFGTVSAFAAETTDTADTADTVVSADTAVEPAVTLEDLTGSYIELFPEMEKEEYADIWLTRLEESAGLDEETAQVAREMLITMMKGEVYGEEAIQLASEEPGYSTFDCFFINGPATITIDGDTISGVDAEGKEIFSHTYVFQESMKMDLGEEMNAMYAEILSEEEWPAMDVYVAEDADDDFKYFAFAGDTPDETYHIEFRYGPELEGLSSYYDGPYAYWLAAGIPADYTDELITNCINLFVDENAPSIAGMFAVEATAEE